MRSILCPVEQSAGLDDCVETALALARTTRGHVTFQVAAPLVQMAVWEPFGGAAVSAEAIAEVRARDEAFARDLDARLASQDVPFDVALIDEDRHQAAAAAARFADVVVASLADPGVEELVLGMRSPILAVPPAAPLLAFDGPVLIAWDGSAQAANAMRAAVPLLALAAAVHIVTVRDVIARDVTVRHRDGSFPAGEAASYLSRHGIHAEVHERERNGSIAFTIEECAREVGAGLIVMGLFGHSRLRELLVGGVSREMLDRSRIPLLLAH